MRIARPNFHSACACELVPCSAMSNCRVQFTIRPSKTKVQLAPIRIHCPVATSHPYRWDQRSTHAHQPRSIKPGGRHSQKLIAENPPFLRHPVSIDFTVSMNPFNTVFLGGFTDPPWCGLFWWIFTFPPLTRRSSFCTYFRMPSKRHPPEGDGSLSVIRRQF